MPLVCPRRITSLMDRCMAEDVGNRPSFEEIVQILAEVRNNNYCFNAFKFMQQKATCFVRQVISIWLVCSVVRRLDYHAGGHWFKPLLNQHSKRKYCL